MYCFRLPKTVVLVLLILMFGIGLTFLNIYHLQQMQKEHWEKSHTNAEPKLSDVTHPKKPIVWIEGKNVN